MIYWTSSEGKGLETFHQQQSRNVQMTPNHRPTTRQKSNKLYKQSTAAIPIPTQSQLNHSGISVSSCVILLQEPRRPSSSRRAAAADGWPLKRMFMAINHGNNRLIPYMDTSTGWCSGEHLVVIVSSCQRELDQIRLVEALGRSCLCVAVQANFRLGHPVNMNHP